MNCIFEEGYTTKEKGRGMGLAIVREIVDTAPNITLNSWVEDGWFQMELFVMGEKS